MTGAEAVPGRGMRTAATLLILVLGGAGGFLLARWMPAAGERSPLVLLDAERPVGPGGTAFAFTLDRPGLVRVTAEVAACEPGKEIRGTFGPLLHAMRPHTVYEPDPARDTAFTVAPKAARSRTFDLEEPGLYAVRFEEIRAAMGSEMDPLVHVRVEWLGSP